MRIQHIWRGKQPALKRFIEIQQTYSSPTQKQTNSISLSSLAQIHPIFHFDCRIELVEEATPIFLRLEISLPLKPSVQKPVVIDHVLLLAGEL
jgi:hypothetical protein